MKIMVVIPFEQDLDAALAFLEDNDLEGSVVFETTAKETREKMLEEDAEDIAAETARRMGLN